MYILVYSVYLLEMRTNMLILCGQDLRKENKHPIQISAPLEVLPPFLASCANIEHAFTVNFLIWKIVFNKNLF